MPEDRKKVQMQVLVVSGHDRWTWSVDIGMVRVVAWMVVPPARAVLPNSVSKEGRRSVA